MEFSPELLRSHLYVFLLPLGSFNEPGQIESDEDLGDQNPDDPVCDSYNRQLLGLLSYPYCSDMPKLSLLWFIHDWLRVLSAYLVFKLLLQKLQITEIKRSCQQETAIKMPVIKF